MRLFSWLLAVCLSLSVCSAQSLSESLPWIALSERVEIGMSEESLKSVYPFLQPMSGGDAAGNELYFDSEKKILGSEDVAFGVKGGKLTKFYWSSKKRVSQASLEKIRKSLRKSFGNPEIGYKARLTKEGIAKLTTEVYRSKGRKDVVVSISSALQITELTVIDLKAEGVSAEELYFSYNRHKKRLQSELARMTGKAPEEEDPADCADVLASLLAKSQGVQGRKVQRNRSTDQDENAEVTGSKSQETSNKEEGVKEKDQVSKASKNYWLVGLAGFTLLGLLALFIKSRKGRSTS